MTWAEVIRKLKAAGFVEVRSGKGSHLLLKHPDSGKEVWVAVHTKKDAGRVPFVRCWPRTWKRTRTAGPMHVSAWLASPRPRERNLISSAPRLSWARIGAREGAGLASERTARRPPSQERDDTNGSAEGITLTR